jgi:hypothetical protein
MESKKGIFMVMMEGYNVLTYDNYKSAYDGTMSLRKAGFNPSMVEYVVATETCEEIVSRI